MNAQEHVKVQGMVEVLLLDQQGRVKFHEFFFNGITLKGFETIIQRVASTGLDTFSHMGIGWGTGAGTVFNEVQNNFQATDLTNRTSRKTTTLTHVSLTKTFYLQATWGVNDPDPTNPVPIEEYGVCSSITKTDNNVVSRQTRVVLNKYPADTLIITYNFAFA